MRLHVWSRSDNMTWHVDESGPPSPGMHRCSSSGDQSGFGCDSFGGRPWVLVRASSRST